MRVIILFAILILFCNCEDVVDVNTPTAEPRLMVDALIPIDSSQAVQTVRVRVGLTGNFFGDLPATELGQITLTNIDMESTFENPNTIILLEREPGVYEATKNTGFFTGGELVLQITHQDRSYFARTNYVPTVPIDTLVQGDGRLFEGDETEIVVTYRDTADREDFYLFDFDYDEYLVTEDTFYQGQEFSFSYFYDNKLQPGDAVNIRILGADEGFYNYMNQVIQQSGDLMGPFSTPAATVRGNIFDVTGLDNEEVFDNVNRPDKFALGYFAVVQQYTRSITIE